MLEHLVRISIEGALLAAVVWVGCRALPQLSSSVRAMLWWCVAAKFVVALVWFSPIGLPVLPAEAPRATPVVAATTSLPVVAELPGRMATGEPAAAAARTVPEIPWTTILLGLWFVGMTVSSVRTFRAWSRIRGVVARSEPGSASVHDAVRELSRRLGLRRTTDVRMSTEVESPLIVGVRRPVILVPSRSFEHLSVSHQQMALCHELAHLKRGDVWLGSIPGIVERCFFFHPLARLAAREYAFWREAACDESVLATLGASPQSYGRLLLELGIARESSAIAAAGAACSFPTLKRRIILLGHRASPSLRTRAIAGAALAAAFLAIAPVKAVARSASATSSDALTVDSASFGQRADTDVAPLATLPADVELEQPRASSSPSMAPVPDTGDSAEPEQRLENDLEFVYLPDNGTTTMSSRTEDVGRARHYQRGDEPLLWFRDGGHEYVVRDPGVLREVVDLWDPVIRIGGEQGRIGAQQGAIGARQGSGEVTQDSELMRELREKMLGLGREMERLRTQMAAADRRARMGMRTLIDRAKRSGAAEAAG